MLDKLWALWARAIERSGYRVYKREALLCEAKSRIHESVILLLRLEDYSTDDEAVVLQEIRDNHLYIAANLIGKQSCRILQKTAERSSTLTLVK